MATKQFKDYLDSEGEGLINNLTDTFKLVLVSNAYSTIDENAANPNLASFTQVAAGGNYASGGVAITATYTGDVLDFTDVSIAKAAGSPTNAKTAIIYNQTADKACQAIDLNAGADVDLVNDNLNITIAAGGAYTRTIS